MPGIRTSSSASSYILMFGYQNISYIQANYIDLKPAILIALFLSEPLLNN